MLNHPIEIHRAGVSRAAELEPADPITTEVIRHALNSAANQMKVALVRTAFSPVIYEVLDFAVAIYDPKMRLLAQAPSLPIFMGTLSFCVDAAVKAVGGEAKLDPGDILLYNWPYGTGSHPQDVAVVMPVFLEAKLIGYTAIKGHWLDIAGKDPYCTDTVDVFQEGTVYPGVKIYRRGELMDDIYRIVLANSRVPKMIAGDLNAEIAGCRVGAQALQRVVERYGHAVFDRAVEHMFDHGEKVVRSFFEKIPDGRYVGRGEMDGNGVTEGRIPFEVIVEVKRLRREPRLHRRARAADRPGQLPAAVDHLVEPGGDLDARRPQRGAERGTFPRHRGEDAAGHHVPPAAAGAVLHLRLGGAAGDRGHLPRHLQGGAERGAGAERRLHLLLRLVGDAGEDRRALGRWLAAPGWPGRLRRRRRRRHAPHRRSRRRASHRSKCGKRRTPGSWTRWSSARIRAARENGAAVRASTSTSA